MQHIKASAMCLFGAKTEERLAKHLVSLLPIGSLVWVRLSFGIDLEKYYVDGEPEFNLDLKEWMVPLKNCLDPEMTTVYRWAYLDSIFVKR